MTSRFTLHSHINLATQHFGVSEPSWEFKPRYNICPCQFAPVVRQKENGRELVNMNWGFSLWNCTDKSLRRFDAATETATLTPMFWTAMKRTRCLIPADGFYEWQKSMTHEPPWYFTIRDRQLFAFAGIWNQCESSEGPIDTFAILTTTPNELMAPLHNRQPLILSPSDYELWLDPTMRDSAKLSHLYKPLPAAEMTKWRVRNLVDDKHFEGPRAIERFGG